MKKILDRVPWMIIWWTDEHLNHVRRGEYRYCVSRWFCDYTDYRAAQPELERLRQPGQR